MNRKGDTFDKEFSLNKKNKKSADNNRGKLPSWLLILAGVSVIGGVVAARQPALRPVENSSKTSLIVPTGQPVVAEPASSITGFNDQQADESELEAHFLTQSGQSNAQYIMPVQTDGSRQGINMDLEPLTTDSSGNPAYPGNTGNSSIVWLDGKPFALTIEAITDKTQSQDAQSVTSIYMLNDQPYEVHLDPVSETEISTMPDTKQSSVVQIGGQPYLLRMTALNQTAEQTAGMPVITAVPRETEKTIKTADETPSTIENKTHAEDKGSENTAVVWFNAQPYAVTVRQQDDTKDENTEAPQVTVPGSNAETKKEPFSATFSADDKQYVLLMEELAPDKVSENTSSVVWLDETPLEVVLTASDKADGSDNSVEVSLNPLPDSQTAALQQERFGPDFRTGTAETTQTETEETEEPSPIPTQAVQEGNWFTDMFTNIFGSSPTNTPTPQVTVIAMSPTPVPVQPTATPIVIQIAAAPVQQGPVRLDGQETGTSSKDGNDLDDPALREEPEETVSSNQPSDNNTVSTQEANPQPTKPAPEKIDAVLLDPVDSIEQPSVQPTQEELPQTGMAESWNIPSLLAMLGGLLLVIIGVRRLRAKN